MKEIDQEQQSVPSQRTRRNIMAMGVIAGSALLARIRLASAEDVEEPDGDADDQRCFLRGTNIQTAQGWRKVQDLAIGDLLPTAFGGTRAIKWIGSYRYKKSNKLRPWAKHVRPVRIARCALAQETPRADLFLTQRHAALHRRSARAGRVPDQWDDDHAPCCGRAQRTRIFPHHARDP